MKALSLTQPWATLVVTGRKRMETRSWRVPVEILGRQRVAIHASKTMPGWAKDAARELGLDPDSLPRGAVIGSVVIAGCSRTEIARLTEPIEEVVLGDYSDGRYAWWLSDAQQHDPIPATGALGFWEWSRPR